MWAALLLMIGNLALCYYCGDTTAPYPPSFTDSFVTIMAAPGIWLTAAIALTPANRSVLRLWIFQVCDTRARGVVVTNDDHSKPVSPTRAHPDDGSLCVVCVDVPANHVIIPCGHVCLCDICSKHSNSSMSLCPICRTPAERIMQVFL